MSKQSATGQLAAEIVKKVKVRRERNPDDLRGRLMLGFAALAILPMIVAVVAMTQIAESGIAVSTDKLTVISTGVLASTSHRIGDESRAQIATTGKQLTDIGSKAVRDTAGTLIKATEKRFDEADKQLIKQGEEANKALSEQLVKQSQDATQQLAGAMIKVSTESNQGLSKATAGLAQKSIVQLSDNLVAQSTKNTKEIGSYITTQNTESAKRLSERILKDIDREPVVNFKTLASIISRGIATSKVTPIRDGYLAVVDARGHVLASTKYRKGTSLKHLQIIQQALAGTASEDQLLHFKEGSDEYLGVFARRDGGGAVVFAYLADHARVDTDRMKGDIASTLNQMGSSSSQYVVQRLEADRQKLHQQAGTLSKTAITELNKTSQTLSGQTATRMQKRADEVSKETMGRMNGQAQMVTRAATEAMKAKSEQIAKNAVEAMRPIGPTSAAMAEMAMRSEADKALAGTDVLKKLADEVATKAGKQMAPAARELANQAKIKMWKVAGGLILLEIILAVMASLLMSGRIATPIMQQQKKAREEQERLGREMEIASRIQTCLLPPVPELQDFDVAVSMVPAEEVGGDFVDLVHDREPGAFWIGIGDVTGHGLTPGLIMMMAQSTFNALARADGMTCKKLYDGMNNVLYQNIKDRLHTSDHMTVSILKHEADGSFIHCGSHLDILIYRAATREVERIVTDGPWVGMLPECSDFTVEQRFNLSPQDVLMLYTDGLIEVQNATDEQWDMDRLCEALAASAHLTAKEIQAKILTESLHWAHKVLDDISMIVIKRSAVEATLTVPQADGQLVSLRGNGRRALPTGAKGPGDA
ncbi:MAG: phosphoserine phosphatase [Cyanobacteria bacterium RYN_339]|nr:phosphoserine phosphatase [Cyanobacteria bacterium RYN_339]